MRCQIELLGKKCSLFQAVLADVKNFHWQSSQVIVGGQKILTKLKKKNPETTVFIKPEEEGRLYGFECMLTKIHKLRFLNVKLGAYNSCIFNRYCLSPPNC